MGDDIFLPMQQLNHLRRQALEALQKRCFVRGNREKRRNVIRKMFRMSKTDSSGNAQRSSTNKRTACGCGTDRRNPQNLCGLRNFPGERLCTGCGSVDKQTSDSGKELFLTLPRIVRDRELTEGKKHLPNWCRKGLAVSWCGIWKVTGSWILWDSLLGSFWMPIFIP